MLEKAHKITPGRRAPTITQLDEEGWLAVSVMVLKNKIATVMDEYVAFLLLLRYRFRNANIWVILAGLKQLALTTFWL